MASASNSAPAHDDCGDDWINAFDNYIGPDDHETTGGHLPGDDSSTTFTSARSHYQHQVTGATATIPAETQQHPVRFAHTASYSSSIASSTVTSIPVATGNVLPVVPEVTVDVPVQQLPVTMQQTAGPTPATCSQQGSAEDDAKAQERSERKRCREKKRRTDANQQFSELSALLRKIEESEEEDEDETGGKKQRSVPSFYRSGNTNRIELVARTVAVLGRLHEENRRRGKQIAELKAEVEEAKKEAKEAKLAATSRQHNPEKQDKVLMMVPMMVSPDSIPSMGGTNSGGGGGGGSCMSAPMAMPNPMQQVMSQWSQAAFSPFPFMAPMGQPASPPAPPAAPASSSPPHAREESNDGQPEGSVGADNSHQSTSTSAEPSVPSSASNTERTQRDQSATNQSPSIARGKNGKGSSSNLAHCA